MRYFAIVLGFSLKCTAGENGKSLKFTRAQLPATINGNDEITCGIPTRLCGTYASAASTRERRAPCLFQGGRPSPESGAYSK